MTRRKFLNSTLSREDRMINTGTRSAKIHPVLIPDALSRDPQFQRRVTFCDLSHSLERQTSTAHQLQSKTQFIHIDIATMASGASKRGRDDDGQLPAQKRSTRVCLPTSLLEHPFE